MKFFAMIARILLTLCLFSQILISQNDTLLFVSFDSAAFSGNNLAVLASNQLDLKGWGNERFSNYNLSSEVIDLNSEWYEANQWKKWHKMPYIERIDTTIVNQEEKYDTIVNVGMRSLSWFSSPNQARDLLLSPPVWLGDNTSKLKWKSMPIQGPRFQDGYKVYILIGDFYKVEDISPEDFTPSFVMQEMKNPPSPAITDSSLAKIQKENGFIPLDGVSHDRYTLPAPSGSGLVDSSRQHSFMQEFEIDLSSYSGPIQILFYHDSYDDVGIIVDDVLITGTGTLSTKDLASNIINAYPNPTENFITIPTNLKDGLLQIFDNNGKLLYTSNQITKVGFEVNTSNLSKGIYHFSITSNTKVLVGNFVKK